MRARKGVATVAFCPFKRASVRADDCHSLAIVLPTLRAPNLVHPWSSLGLLPKRARGRARGLSGDGRPVGLQARFGRSDPAAALHVAHAPASPTRHLQPVRRGLRW